MSDRLPGTVDVAVVGAGAAGIAAARAVRAAGRSVLVLEAKDRIGGRAWTREILPGVPVDLGAHWLHSADVNPLAALGRAAGFTLGQSDLDREVFFPDEGRWADSAERRERHAFFDRCEAAIAAAAATGPDRPIAAVLPDHPRWRPMFEHWVTVYTGVDADAASVADYVAYRDTHNNWPVREGYGALVARCGDGLPVALAAPVTAIEYGRRPVRLTTPAGTVTAHAVILTVSTGVLAAETIRFDPPLPDWKCSAIDAVPMGSADWVLLAFDRNPFGVEDSRVATIWSGDARTIGFQIRPHGCDLALGYLGGRLCCELERAGPTAMIEFARERLKAAFGSAIDRHLAATLSSAWQADPAVRGAYSAARIGEAHRRADLAQPIDEALFFAGEATDPEFFSTVHGAWRSGERAVAEALQALEARGAP